MFLGDKGRPARKAENLTAICERTVYKMWEPRRLTTGIASPFYCHNICCGVQVYRAHIVYVSDLSIAT
jgi:hypothetical protein